MYDDYGVRGSIPSATLWRMIEATGDWMRTQCGTDQEHNTSKGNRGWLKRGQ